MVKVLPASCPQLKLSVFAVNQLSGPFRSQKSQINQVCRQGSTLAVRD
jgi:hypothetical protein